MNRHPYRFLLSLLLLGVGLILSVIFNPTIGIEAKSVTIEIDSQRHLVSRIYTPTTPTPHPVILLCHGVNNSKEMMASLAVELARHGIAAIAFDFGGYGESYPLKTAEKSIENLEKNSQTDAKTVIAYIRSHPEIFDQDKIGILGHSMGGATALALGKTEEILRSTIILGMSGIVTPTIPRNLFLGAGLYEQINPPQDLRVTLQEATGKKNPVCINDSKNICGNFTDATARLLIVSDTADHIIEPYDPKLIREVVNWAQRSLSVTRTTELKLITPTLIISIALTFIGGIASGVSILTRPYEKIRRQTPETTEIISIEDLHFYQIKKVAKLKVQLLWRQRVTWLLGIQMTVIWLMAINGLAPTRGASNMLVFCYVLQLCSNYALRHPDKFTAIVRVVCLYILLFIGAFLLPTLLCGVNEILSTPNYLIGLPQFLLLWPFFLFYYCSVTIKLILIPAYTLELQVSWLFVCLVFLELILPGVTLTKVEQFLVVSDKWLSRPFVLTGVGNVSSKQVGLLGFLLLALIGVWSQRVADGLLGVAMSKGMLALQMLGLFLFLPLAIIVVTVRSSWFQRLRSWLFVTELN
ncbi:alpha/beta hydrolase [Dapis sp. BLCC M172]|uniref:alpha/beta hydrolase n=1 Tax=Dapis sp. BLCC M172 TaxID=2975281 RepID=UPI003CEAA60E